MTTQKALLQSASSSASATNSLMLNGGNAAITPTATNPFQLYKFESFASTPFIEPADPEFDQLLADLAKDRDHDKLMAEGREWVGETYYQGEQTLSTLRLKSGLSQKDLAEQCGMEQSHISRYESGRTDPGIEKSRMLADALRVSLDDFHTAWSLTRSKADQKSKVT